ncbi:hypothetical protein [Nocardia sp. NPDC057030]|uniref:hypothetical protein n=1 Tax=unclassified Nocardia TaxID=2637762 RepID=UPI00362CB0D3
MSLQSGVIVHDPVRIELQIITGVIKVMLQVHFRVGQPRGVSTGQRHRDRVQEFDVIVPAIPRL